MGYEVRQPHSAGSKESPQLKGEDTTTIVMEAMPRSTLSPIHPHNPNFPERVRERERGREREREEGGRKTDRQTDRQRETD